MIKLWFKSIWKFFLENLDTLLAVGLSITAAAFGVFGGKQFQNQLLSAIAGALGLLAASLLRDRMSREKLAKLIEELRPTYNAGIYLKDRSSYKPFDKLIESAQYIGMVGPSLVNIFLPWKDYFQNTKLLEHGAEIQTILLDSKSPALESVADCIGITPESLKQEIRNTIIQADALIEGIERTQRGIFELRLLKANPNYSMILIDPDKPDGIILVEFIGYRANLHKRPHIELHRDRDGDWYKHFLDQYKELLNKGMVHRSSKKN